MNKRGTFNSTGRGLVSVGVGVLVPFVAVLAASFIGKAILFWIAVLTPFVAAFVASLTFGCESRDRLGKNLLIAFAASLTSIVGLLSVMALREPPAMEPVGFAIYMAMVIFPISVVGFLIATFVGAIAGWLTASSMER